MVDVGGVYPKVDMTGGSSSFPEMERIVGAYWDEDGTCLLYTSDAADE